MTARAPGDEDAGVASAESPSGAGTRRRSAVTAVGASLAVVAVGLVARTIWRDRDELGDALADAGPGWLVLAGAGAAAAMALIALGWRATLRLLGGSLDRPETLARYFVGELGKYVPGGVWAVMGRAEMATAGGVGRLQAYSSVALSLASMYLAAGLVVLAGVPLVASGSAVSYLWVLVVLPLGVLGLHPAVGERGLALARRMTGRTIEVRVPTWSESARLVARYVPVWLVVGASTWAVARSLDPAAPLAEVVVAAVLSWIVGFVLVPVPGGVGVREAVFVAAATSLEPAVAAGVALAARVLFVVVDVGGAGLGWWWLRRNDDRTRAHVSRRPGPG